MKSISATNARNQWFSLIEQAGKPGAFVAISHRDLPDVVIMSVDEFEGWQETIEIMSNPTLVEQIQKGLNEIKSEKTTNLDAVKKKIKM